MLAKLKSKRRVLRSPIFSAGTSNLSLWLADSLDNTARRSSSRRLSVLLCSARLVMNWLFRLMLKRDSSLTDGGV
ncbi:hypothetical protein D3C76_1744500 [compost metagenome]